MVALIIGPRGPRAPSLRITQTKSTPSIVSRVIPSTIPRVSPSPVVRLLLATPFPRSEKYFTRCPATIATRRVSENE